MIKIFDPNDTIFNTNGNICIIPKSCVEIKKKSLNGWYLNLEVDIKYKDYIKKDYLVVIKSKSNINPQAFRIADDDNDNSIQYTDRSIIFKANHVCFDSKKYFLVDVRPTNLNAIAALEYINERTDQESPFFVYSDISNISTSYFIRKNLLEAWVIFEERYGGYFQFDNWNVKLSSTIGKDTGEIIAYGQKLQGFQIFESWSNVVTKLYPIGPNGIMLDEEYLLSDVQYDVPYTKCISFTSDLEIENQTTENLKNELREKSQKYLDLNKYPLISYEVTSNINQNLDIGDIVHIKHPLADIKVEVLEYSYDHVTNRISSLVFGNFVRSVKNKIDSIKQNIVEQSEKLSEHEKILINQSELINNLNKNGIVYIDDNEILILDKTPKTAAKNIWRFGLGGIAFSSNGYEGPFSTAITQNGQINADFITIGKINTKLIEGYDQLVTKVLKTETTVENITTTTQTSTGENSLNITDSLESNALEYHVEGKSEQETRSGRNLLNMPYTENNKLTATATRDDHYWVTDYYAELEAGKNYTFHFKTDSVYGSKGVEVYFLKDKSHDGIVYMASASITDTGYTFTPTVSGDYYLRFDVNVSGETHTFWDFYIAQEDSFSGHEQYGSSPSPDYPSEIKTISSIKNLLENKLENGSLNGIDYIVNKDKSVTLNGTATADFILNLNDGVLCKTGIYSLSGCPSNGNLSTYRLFIRGTSYADYGTGTRWSLASEKTLIPAIAIMKGTTVSDLTFKPMLEKGLIAHKYIPYGSWIKAIITGKNILKPEFDVGDMHATTGGNENNTSRMRTRYIKVKPNTAYTISSSLTHNRLIEYDKDGNFVNATFGYSTFITKTNTRYIRASFTTTTVPTDAQLEEVTEENPEPTEYEEYKEKEVLIDLNKPNLFDKDNFIETKLFRMTNNILGEASTLKSFMFDVSNYNIITIQKISGARFGISATVEYPVVGDSVVLLKDYNNNDTSATIDVSKYNYILVGYWTSNGEDTLTEQEVLNSIEIYEGCSPYYELSSIRDIKDTLDIVNGQVVIDKKIGKIVLDGSENWTQSGTSRFSINLDGYLDGVFRTLCSHFVEIDDWAKHDSLDNSIILYKHNTWELARLSFKIEKYANNGSGFKTWLSENNVTVHYELAESKQITLPNVNIPLFDGVNHITLVDDLETTTSIKYYRKTPISSDYVVQQQLDETNSNLSTTTDKTNQNASDINETNINLNNNYYNKDQIDVMNTSTEQIITQIRNQVETTTSATNLQITVLQEQLKNGVTSVVTETGYRFDKDGLSISKTGEPMRSVLDNNGLTVYRDETIMLKADSNEVITNNLTVKTYLIVGDNTRVEDYKGGTGFFYIGGGN